MGEVSQTDLVQYADNREQNLHTLYRRCKQFVDAYEKHEAVKRSESAILAPTQRVLETARWNLRSMVQCEDNNEHNLMEKARPDAPRTRRKR